MQKTAWKTFLASLIAKNPKIHVNPVTNIIAVNNLNFCKFLLLVNSFGNPFILLLKKVQNDIINIIRLISKIREIGNINP